MQSREVVTLEKLDEIVARDLQTSMLNTNYCVCMQEPFASYLNILINNDFQWMIDDNQKVAVQHVLSSVRPANLCKRLELNLSFWYHFLKQGFRGFFKYAVKLAEAFHVDDAGTPRKHS